MVGIVFFQWKDGALIFMMIIFFVSETMYSGHEKDKNI